MEPSTPRRILAPALLGALAFALALSCAFAWRASAADAPPPGIQRYFMTILTRGPRMPAPQMPPESLVVGHLAHIRAMCDEGLLRCAGPFADDAGPLGIFIFKADTITAVEEELAQDPLVHGGWFAARTIPWYTMGDLGAEFRARIAAHPETRDSLKSYTFVFLKRGPTWTAKTTPAVQKVLAGHMANITRLHDTGALVSAGPFGDDGDLRGIFVFEGDSARAAELCATDPAVKAKRFVTEIHPWMTWPGVFAGH